MIGYVKFFERKKTMPFKMNGNKLLKSTTKYEKRLKTY